MEVLEMVGKIKEIEKLCLQTIREREVTTRMVKNSISDSASLLKSQLANEILTIIEKK